MCGWIKMHRSLLQWEWFQKSEMVQLFVYLLLKASVEDRKWQGIDVKRGQVVTSVATICRDLSLSTKKVRNCLEHLKNSQVISIKTTNKFSVITICNYATYQAYETPEGQTEGKQRATSKECKNINNIINNNNACVCVREEEFSTELKQDQAWLEVMAKNYGLSSTQVVADWLDKFDIDNQCRNKSHTDLSDYRRHFNDWLRIQIREIKKNQNESTKKNKRDGYYEPTATSADDYYNSSF